MMESAMAWGSFESPMVDLSAVCVIGLFTTSVFGVIVVVGQAIPVLLFMTVEGEVGTGVEAQQFAGNSY